MGASFAHTGISVTDLDAAARWYAQRFGFVELKRFEKPELALKGALLELEGRGLEILEPYTPAAPAEGSQKLVDQLARTGANHIALGVDDVPATYERFVVEGTEMVSELIDGRFFFCQDPFGTLIEVRPRG